jgi:pimeloyl-ACP methyl ester carboxylesterase
MNPGAPADHVTPYDRMALSEAALIALLASPQRHEGLVEYFGEKLHADLVKLARATQRPAGGPRRRVYLLPGIMGSQLGFVRGGQRPDDILWLDPIDINFGRLTELRFPGSSSLVALGAMSYTYLKLTLSLRKAGFDTVLVGYDWRQEVAAVGRELAERVAAEGVDNIALVGHSMGGLVARAALAQPGGKHVSQLVMLGTPNHGSVGAVQALRGTYSVVRKLAMLDLKHDAEFLAREVFSSFPGVHELLPSGKPGGLDLFDSASWPVQGPGPDAALLRAAAGLHERLAPADGRFDVVVGCNRITATRVALHDGDFEYEYSLRGDGTVPIDLARLDGARHRYVDCDHSDMPLSDRVIAGTIDLLNTGRTRRFAASPRIRRNARRRVRDEDLRREYQGKVDWPQMSPEERRLFLDNLNEPPRGMNFGHAGARKPKARAHPVARIKRAKRKSPAKRTARKRPLRRRPIR